MKRYLLISLLVLLLAAACSNQPATQAPPTRTTIPTYNYISPTPVAQVATAVATQAAAQPSGGADAQAIEAGRGRYEALDCASCHGENGEGVDDAPTLVGLALSQDDFVTYMRTGGPIGTDHQYQSNRLSDRGAVNLYHYLVSLSS